MVSYFPGDFSGGFIGSSIFGAKSNSEAKPIHY